MKDKFVAIVFSLIWAAAYFNWDWNGWGALFFAAFCAGGIGSLLGMVNIKSGQQTNSTSRSAVNSNRNIMGKVCKNSVCGYQNGWSALTCRRCGRFLGL